MQARVLLVAAMLAIASPVRAQLTADDVQRVIGQGVSRAVRISPNSVIAVSDREGFVLGVWNVRGGEPTPDEIANAVSRAGTAAFLSSNANAFSTRTAGFIIQQHFPPGVRYTAPGTLVGVGFSNLPFSDVNRFKRFLGPVVVPPLGISPGTRGAPIPGTSLDGSPSGLPLYKDGRLVGASVFSATVRMASSEITTATKMWRSRRRKASRQTPGSRPIMFISTDSRSPTQVAARASRTRSR